MNISSNLFFLLSSLLLVGCFQKMYGQEDTQYTQYMYNTSVINPAYTGSVNSLQFFGLYRAQWTGIEGAPQTANLSMAMPIDYSNFGIGGNLVQETIGAMNRTAVAVDLAYRVELNRDYQLAFGMKGTMEFTSVDYTKLTIHDVNDPVSENNISNRFTPNVGAGVFFYSDRLYVGVSIPTIFKRDRFSDNEYSALKKDVNFYWIGGYVIHASDMVVVKPTFMLKTVSGGSAKVDFSTNVTYADRFTAGVSYQWNSAISALAGFQATDQLFVGYAYDASVSGIRTVNTGSHEILLRFELDRGAGKRNTGSYF